MSAPWPAREWFGLTVVIALVLLAIFFVMRIEPRKQTTQLVMSFVGKQERDLTKDWGQPLQTITAWDAEYGNVPFPPKGYRLEAKQQRIENKVVLYWDPMAKGTNYVCFWIDKKGVVAAASRAVK